MTADNRLTVRSEYYIWTRRTLITAFVLLALLLATIIVIIVVVLSPHKIKTTLNDAVNVIGPKSVKECTSDGCKEAAAILKKSMNMYVNPCEDFYEFSCGRWRETERIPKDLDRWDNFNIANREMTRNLKELLQNNLPSKRETDLSATEKAQLYYHSCVYEENMSDYTNIILLRQHIEEIIPKYTNFPWQEDSSYPTIQELLDAAGRARKYGITLGFFENFLDMDFSNLSNLRRKVIQLEQPKLSMLASYYSNKNGMELAAYRKMLMDTFSLLNSRSGIKTSQQNAALGADDIVAIDKVILKAIKSSDEFYQNYAPKLPQCRYTFETFADYLIDSGLTAAHLVQYFKAAWNNSEINTRLSENTNINILRPSYFLFLIQDLQKRCLENTLRCRRMITNYFVWQITKQYTDYMGPDFQTISRTFRLKLGHTEVVPRSQTCLDIVEKALPNAVVRLYVERYYRETTTAKVKKMMKYATEAFKTIINDSEWINNDTRLTAFHKLDEMEALIGYNNYIMNDTDRLDREYKDIAITNSFLQNAIRASAWLTQLESLKLTTEENVSSRQVSLTDINAFYFPWLNSLKITAGILQPPFFGNHYPDYWNFGAIGSIIAHEITHGFDDKGILYGVNGSLINWWDENSRTNYNDRIAELKYQYGNFTLMGQKINEELTLGDNIADNGAIREAFYAYRNYIKDRNIGTEAVLPGLPYSPEQIFFLANAQVWCSDVTLSGLQNQIKTDVHAPKRFRVIGPMQNLEEFAEVFKCPVGSYMNPKKKIRVW